MICKSETTPAKKYSKARHAAAPSLLKSAQIELENVAMGEAILEFANKHRKDGNRERSIAESLRQVKYFADFMESEGLAIRDIRERHADSFILRRMESVGKRTARHCAVEIRAFFAFCKKRGYIASNPLAEWEIPEPDETHRKMPSESDIMLVFEAIAAKNKAESNPCKRHKGSADAERFYTTRDQAIVAVATDSGLRSGEILALSMDDYDHKNKQLIIKRSKTRKGRIVPISSLTVKIIDAWLKERPKEATLRMMDYWQDKTDEDGNWMAPTLFVTEGGSQIAVSNWSRQFKRYCEIAGVEGIVPHCLRHYAATQLAKANVLAARDILGHSSVKTTEIYTHNDADHVREFHSAADPLGRVFRTTNKRRPTLIGG